MKKMIIVWILSLMPLYCQAALPLGIRTIDVRPTGCETEGPTLGAITLAIEEGVAPYTYFVDENVRAFTNDTSTLFSNLRVGDYRLRVEDSSEPTQSVEATVPVGGPEPLSVENIAISNPVSGGANGSIVFTTNGGTDPITFTIDGRSQGNSGAFVGLPARVTPPYTIVVSTNDNCPSSTFAIPLVGEEVTSFSFTVVVTPPSCNPKTPSIVTVQATGGVSPYRYSVDNGLTFQVSPVFTGLVAGLYSVVVIDSVGTRVRQDIRVGTVINP
ncbi:SprB repeat-containing protein, partial [Candidatus Dependentiae bacterium]|nr:SprB repeat-containing protein [Candidatus Dependentiae bacterium]